MKMWELTKVDVLGLVVNMSAFVCPGCGERHDIFNPPTQAGAEAESPLTKACREKNIEILGDIPINGAICRDADRGVPSVVGEPDGEAARVFMEIARKVGVGVGL